MRNNTWIGVPLREIIVEPEYARQTREKWGHILNGK